MLEREARSNQSVSPIKRDARSLARPGNGPYRRDAVDGGRRVGAAVGDDALHVYVGHEVLVPDEGVFVAHGVAVPLPRIIDDNPRCNYVCSHTPFMCH